MTIVDWQLEGIPDFATMVWCSSSHSRLETQNLKIDMVVLSFIKQ